MKLAKVMTMDNKMTKNEIQDNRSGNRAWK